MKIFIIFLCLSIVHIPEILAQNPTTPVNTTDRIIEGGNLIIEILKVINNNDSDKKKAMNSKEWDCATKKFTNICFINKSPRIIIVNLEKKTVEEEYELIIANNGKECCYRVSPGVYKYSIAQKSSLGTKKDLIRKGEVMLEVCKDLEIKIK